MELSLSAYQWLDKRQKCEGAQGLWRIHDKIYDLQQWIDKHPGGKQWIQITKGTDITEAFESHHITTKAEKLLPKFYVGEAKTARNFPFTFNPDGFYNTLKNRIRQELKNDKHLQTHVLSSTFLDTLLFTCLSLSITAGVTNNYYVATLAGVFLAFMSICAHNFVHKKDNWRMYYLSLSSMSIKETRIIHSLSHHMYTNSSEDLEVTLFEPWFQWLPKEKPYIVKVFSPLYSPIIYASTMFGQFISRVVMREFCLEDCLMFVIPSLIWIFRGTFDSAVFLIWIWIIMCCSMTYVFVGVTAAHHHPEIYHHGDARRLNRDWGLYQIDATRERIETRGNTFFVLISFGDHVLHHLFPTIDHAWLPYIYPVFEKTCHDFGLNVKSKTVWQLIFGQFKQLMRTTPNPIPPST